MGIIQQPVQWKVRGCFVVAHMRELSPLFTIHLTSFYRSIEYSYNLPTKTCLFFSFGLSWVDSRASKELVPFCQGFLGGPVFCHVHAFSLFTNSNESKGVETKKLPETNVREFTLEKNWLNPSKKEMSWNPTKINVEGHFAVSFREGRYIHWQILDVPKKDQLDLLSCRVLDVQ